VGIVVVKIMVGVFWVNQNPIWIGSVEVLIFCLVNGLI
jgi:hypothetical protein